MKSKFLTAEWRKLAIANYSVDPGILIPHLPYKTELDFWQDKCYVSLVGFRFINTKLKGIPVPFHRHFEEINLRFYVRYKEGNTWKRAVTFIKEIVPKYALTFVANSIYNEKYVTLPTKHSWIYHADSIDVCYEWKHNNEWDSLKINAEKTALEIFPGTEEEFITEHYWGYTRLNPNQTSEYQVEHPRWQIYPVKTYDINVRFDALYGSQFGFLKNVRPAYIMLAEGSEITVRNSQRIYKSASSELALS
jgi:uncharacterized protein